MKKSTVLLAGMIVASLAGCDRRKAPGSEMAPAESWNAEGGGGGDNPHAGMAMPGGADDPHAGIDMNHGQGMVPEGDPHAGMDMERAMAPDPGTPVDPAKYLRGTLDLGSKTAGKLPAQGVLFVYAKPTSGGMPVAVQKLPIGEFPQEFQLTGADAMAKGTVFDGEVTIIARVDQGGDVSSRDPGDLSGELKATIPSEGLQLTLDTVQP